MALIFDPKAKVAPRPSPPPPPAPGIDWGDVAEVHAIEAQLVRYELDDTLDAITALDDRLASGDTYRARHPDDERGYLLYRELEERRRHHLVTVSILRWRAWEACRTTHMALTRAEPARRQALVRSMGETSCDSPEALWRALWGADVPVPQGRAEVVEPVIRVEPWLLETLRARLEDREHQG